MLFAYYLLTLIGCPEHQVHVNKVLMPVTRRHAMGRF